MTSGEILGHRLLTLHNLHFLFTLLSRIRDSIAEGEFASLLAMMRAESAEGYATIPSSFSEH